MPKPERQRSPDRHSLRPIDCGIQRNLPNTAVGQFETKLPLRLLADAYRIKQVCAIEQVRSDVAIAPFRFVLADRRAAS